MNFFVKRKNKGKRETNIHRLSVALVFSAIRHTHHEQNTAATLCKFYNFIFTLNATHKHK